MRILTWQIVFYVPLLVAGLTALTFVCPMKMSRKAKLFWFLALLFGASRGVAYRLLGGHAQAPSLPEWVIWSWDWMFASMSFLLLFSLVWWRRNRRSLLVMPLLAGMIAAVGFVNGLVLPRVNVVEIASPRIVPALDGYRIVQLTDLHCSNSMRGWRTRGIVEKINSVRPDLIVLTGDLVDGRFDDLREDMEPLRDLKARDGVVMVSGNHEYFINWPRWAAWYRERGLRFLQNECVVPRDGLAIGGVNDINAASRGKAPPPDVGKAFSTATNGEFRVLLQHRPIFIHANFSGHGVDLQLSGHTHGGLMPIVSQLIANRNEGYVRGLYRIGKGWLYVSPGVGQWAGFPLRLANPSEITLFVLRHAEE